MEELTRTSLIAEGVIEDVTEEDFLRAWQSLIDSGVAWQLQGWFGRVANHLIQSGTCSPPKHPEEQDRGA